jgi:transcriptional regulator with XRE-family HTH domain
MAFNISDIFSGDPYGDDFISPGSIGGKIRRIRELRNLTQKQLGIMCGFSQSTADVRIAQYEKNKKVPREKALKDIAGALKIEEYSLFDADLLPTLYMYHALFDLEDFHGLHPVKIDDNYYLEFSGPTMLDNRDIFRHDFDSFLENWYEMRQKYISSFSKSPDEKKAIETEYTLWKYEYPENVSKEHEQKMHERMKRRRLQAQKDALNAELNSESELNRLDIAIKDVLRTVKEKYSPIIDGKEFRKLLSTLVDSGAPIELSSPEAHHDFDYAYQHLFSIKTDDIVSSNENKKIYAELLCCIESMINSGIDIRKKITSNNDILYITFEYSMNDYEYFYNLD